MVLRKSIYPLVLVYFQIMSTVELPKDDTPENRGILYKEALKSSRTSLLIAQTIVQPTNSKWEKIDNLIKVLEEMITSKEVL